jgi:hypothetical protein
VQHVRDRANGFSPGLESVSAHVPRHRKTGRPATRLSLTAQGEVHYELKKAYSDGTT